MKLPEGANVLYICCLWLSIRNVVLYKLWGIYKYTKHFCVNYEVSATGYLLIKRNFLQVMVITGTSVKWEKKCRLSERRNWQYKVRKLKEGKLRFSIDTACIGPPDLKAIQNKLIGSFDQVEISLWIQLGTQLRENWAPPRKRPRRDQQGERNLQSRIPVQPRKGAQKGDTSGAAVANKELLLGVVLRAGRGRVGCKATPKFLPKNRAS